MTVDKTVTLRAQMDNHQPLVFESHGMDARYRQMGSVAPAMSARYDGVVGGTEERVSHAGGYRSHAFQDDERYLP